MRLSPLPHVLLAVALSARLVGQTDETVPTTPTPPPTVVIGDEIASTLSRDRDTLSVDFPNEEIRTVLRNVADLFELNLVIPDTLQGSTSIKLRDVTWRQIFQVVLSPVGYTFVEDGNIIKIVSQDTLMVEPVTTDVFILNYARAEDLRPSVEPLVESAAGGRVVVNKRSNALVITERPSRLSRIRPLIEQLDKATEQVMIESKFVEVTDRDIKNLGVNWASLNGYNVRLDGATQEFNRARGQERQSGGSSQGSNSSTSNTRSGTENGTTLDSSSTNRSGVTTTNGVATTTGSVQNSTSMGTTSSTTNSSGLSNEISSVVDSLSSLVNTGGTERLTNAVFSAANFDIILSALRTQNETKLVSNPTVVTLNNTEAQILVGQKYPVAKPRYNQETGQIYYDIETQDIGVQLMVTPQVNAQGFIRLKVKPIVSSLAGTATIPGGAEYPIVATREAQTEVSLKDGFTMGIGGLIENSAVNVQTKVPVLGSIPGLGRLFRSDSKNQDKRNLIIFITAKTVNAEGAEIGEVFDPRAIRDMKLRRDELPGYRDGSDPFAPPPEVVAPGKGRR
jgi:type II secretory pathway component GspD/PulD (secretin)